jgi:hypothetical protein
MISSGWTTVVKLLLRLSWKAEIILHPMNLGSKSSDVIASIIILTSVLLGVTDKSLMSNYSINIREAFVTMATAGALTLIVFGLLADARLLSA